MFYSDAKQDQFIANLFNFKKNGYFIDIGSCGAVNSNNSLFFESLDWNGLCVELNSDYNESYHSRKTHYINDDALKLNYEEIFLKLNFPSQIDYLSVDIDELSYDVIVKLPHSKYRFSSITIEHDAYHLGTEYQDKQRKFLHSINYELICGNVFVEQDGYGPSSPFEDWWVDPKQFDKDFINKIKCENDYPSNILKKFS